MVALVNLIHVTFHFGGLAQINSGILASIFVTGVVFTIIIFYFKYDQKISRIDTLGTVLVIVCVLLIAFGGAIALQSQDKEANITGREADVILAVVFALISGFFYALRPLSMKYSMDVGFDVT